MNHIEDLGRRLKADEVIPDLERAYSPYRPLEVEIPLDELRAIKVFLHREKERIRMITRGTLLDSTDCLTLAVTAQLLAYRRGLETRVVRPKNITRYFHAMLEYDSEEGPQVFKLTGRNRKYEPTPLSNDQIERRITYIRPVVNLVNAVRFRQC